MKCLVCETELTGKQTKYCSIHCKKIAGKRKRKGLPINVRPKRSHLEWTDKDLQNRINTKSSKMVYIGGYEDCESTLYLYCDDCGQPFKWSAENLRKNRRSIRCTNCAHIISNADDKERKQIQERNKREKQEAIIQRRLEAKKSVCAYCGKDFMKSKYGTVYCSAECRKKADNRQHELRKRLKRRTTMCDRGITIERIIKRDGNKCWLCNKAVDYNDYTIKGNHFVAGRNYPSLDHVVALANGGQHTWDNVRLAHRQCNTLKNDKMFYVDKNEQLTIFV